MELTKKEYIVAFLMLALLITSFLTGAFMSKMQMKDVIEANKEYCDKVRQYVQDQQILPSHNLNNKIGDDFEYDFETIQTTS